MIYHKPIYLDQVLFLVTAANVLETTGSLDAIINN
jgi:hypothetical protein